MVQGALAERSLAGSRSRPRPRERLLGPGALRTFGENYVHDVTGSAERTVSIHVYGPALVQMTRYELRDESLLVTSRERAGSDW